MVYKIQRASLAPRSAHIGGENRPIQMKYEPYFISKSKMHCISSTNDAMCYKYVKNNPQNN